MGQNDQNNLVNLIRGAAKKDIQDIKSEAEHIFAEIKDEEVKQEIELFNGLIAFLARSDSVNCVQNTLATINAIGNLNSQIDVIDDKLVSAMLISKLRSYFISLKKKLKNLSIHLWQLLSQLMSPKEWSIQGGAGISNLFGLSGNIQIQITFGN